MKREQSLTNQVDMYIDLHRKFNDQLLIKNINSYLAVKSYYDIPVIIDQLIPATPCNFAEIVLNIKHCTEQGVQNAITYATNNETVANIYDAHMLHICNIELINLCYKLWPEYKSFTDLRAEVVNITTKLPICVTHDLTKYMEYVVKREIHAGLKDLHTIIRENSSLTCGERKVLNGRVGVLFEDVASKITESLRPYIAFIPNQMEIMNNLQELTCRIEQVEKKQ